MTDVSNPFLEDGKTFFLQQIFFKLTILFEFMPFRPEDCLTELLNPENLGDGNFLPPKYHIIRQPRHHGNPDASITRTKLPRDCFFVFYAHFLEMEDRFNYHFAKYNLLNNNIDQDLRACRDHIMSGLKHGPRRDASDIYYAYRYPILQVDNQYLYAKSMALLMIYTLFYAKQNSIRPNDIMRLETFVRW
jgi:hypothetical protein